MKKKKCYDLGGILQSVLPQLAGTAVSAAIPIPGLNMVAGGLTTQVLSQATAQRPQALPQTATVNTNPYGYALGGKLVGNDGAVEVQGNTHQQGGVNVSPATGVPTQTSQHEVEDGEVIVGPNNQKFVFSNRLKI